MTDPTPTPISAPMPGPISPMLAVAGSMPGDPGGWSFEVKWDGMRAVVHASATGVTVHSRTLRDVTPLWPELAALPAALDGSSVVLDGELIAPDHRGRPSFERLQPRMQASTGTATEAAAAQPAVYMVFDVLWHDGVDLCPLPHSQRRERLVRLGLDDLGWRTPPQLATDDTVALEASVRGLGLEGVVAKRPTAPYRPGMRSPDWRKVKFLLAQEFVVGGWLEGTGGRAGAIGSLVLGVHDAGGGLVYAGRVGTGFTDAERGRLAAALAPLETGTSPFAVTAPPGGGLHWVRPEVVVDVAFTEWTSGGVLRQPAYRGRRLDKIPGEVVRET